MKDEDCQLILVSPPFLPAHFSPCIFKRHLPSQASIRWVFGACSGFACVGCASFKTFWPLALVQQALAALVFVVRGLCGHFRFCALGLTRRSSRPAYCGRLILFVSTTETQLYLAHVYSNGIQFLKRCTALCLSFLWASPAVVTRVFSIFGL